MLASTFPCPQNVPARVFQIPSREKKGTRLKGTGLFSLPVYKNLIVTCRLQSPGSWPKGQKKLTRLTAISAAHRRHTPPGCSTLCCHHGEVCRACTFPVIAMHVHRSARFRSCPAPRVVSGRLQISGLGAPGPLWMGVPHSPGRSSRDRLLGFWAAGLVPESGVSASGQQIGPALPIFSLSTSLQKVAEGT